MLDILLLIAFSGGAVYLIMVLRARRQIHALVQAQKEHARFRALTELTADWFWETDTEHRIRWLSGGGPVATFFGQTATFGKRIWELPGVEVDPAALAALQRNLEAHAPFDLEIARADERGARQVHIISGLVRHAEDGSFLGYRGVGRDITEQRGAERALFRAKERLELALDGGDLAEFHYDVESGLLSAGDGWVRFLGHENSPSVAHAADFAHSVHPEDVARCRKALVRALKGETPDYDAQFRIRTRSGDWTWLHARGRVTERGADGRAKRMSGTLADINEARRAEAALAEREQRFRDVVDASGEYVWETDAEWRYTYLSERAEAVLGYPRAELLGRKPKDFMPLGEPRAVDDWFAGRAAEGQPFRDLLHRLITKSGGVIWQAVNGKPLHAEGRLRGWRGTAADVTARKQAEARIEQLATRDALTGLASRALLAERAGQAILAAARARSRIAFLVLDLDRFKLVNEALGHQAGDALLRAVAERLQNALGREATLARLGGDDFVLLEPAGGPEEAAGLASRVLGILARPFTIEGRALHVGGSIGIALYPEHGRDLGELLKCADAALYHAKEGGRGTWRLYESALGERAATRLRVENELRGALARSELVLHWHPVLRGRGEIVGAEALVRWQHPERGLLMPEEFVPLAEECGLIRAVGEWTLERALSQVGAWQSSLPGRPWFAINVSAPELAQGERFFEQLNSSLKANGVDGARLEIEVTERVLMSHLPENVETLRRIGELGVRFSIDDFGTGYSSLAYLRRLPIDKLKIDRMFLRGIESDAADQAIVRTIASLASTLGMAVAAEGVDGAGQLEALLKLGCEQWQGHHFSEPLDATAFERLYLASLRADKRA